MSLFSKGFYKYHARDFVVVLAGSLQVGDMISLPGPGNTYGVARIDQVTDCAGQLIVVEHILPDGVDISNGKNRDVNVKWDGKRHIVRVSVYINAAKEVLILDDGNGGYDDPQYMEERNDMRRLGRR